MPLAAMNGSGEVIGTDGARFRVVNEQGKMLADNTWRIRDAEEVPDDWSEQGGKLFAVHAGEETVELVSKPHEVFTDWMMPQDTTASAGLYATKGMGNIIPDRDVVITAVGAFYQPLAGSVYCASIIQYSAGVITTINGQSEYITPVAATDTWRVTWFRFADPVRLTTGEGYCVVISRRDGPDNYALPIQQSNTLYYGPFDWQDGRGHVINIQSAEIAAGDAVITDTATRGLGFQWYYVGDPPEPPEPEPATGPAAEFVGSPLTGVVPLVVDFTDMSIPGTSAITVWAWNTGLNLFATENCSETYNIAGSYTVSLTVTTADGNDTETKTAYVEALAAPASNRVTDALQALYVFNAGAGTTIADTGGVGTAYDLTVQSAGAVTWGVDAGHPGLPDYLNLDSATYLSNGEPFSKFITAVKDSNAWTIEAWLDPSAITGSTLKRIVNLGPDKSNRNCLLALTGDEYAARTRSTATDDNGGSNVATLTSPATVGDQMQVVATWDGINVRIYIDGTYVTGSAIGGTASNWNDGYRLILGNEFSLDRSYLGKFYLVAIYSKALSATEVAQNYEAAGGVPPVVPDAPVADFSGAPVLGAAPLAVVFADASTGGVPTSWAWTFGDGGTDNVQNPNYTYNNPGTYTVTMTATNAGGTSIRTRYSYITATGVVAGYFVDGTNGDDANAGTAASPWKHIERAVPELKAGDTLYIMPGTYAFDGVDITANGTAGNPITIQAYGSGEVIIDGGYIYPTTDKPHYSDQGLWYTYNPMLTVRGQYVVIDGITMAHITGPCIQVEAGGDHCTIQNMTFEHCRQAALKIQDAEYCSVIDCTSDYTSDYCTHRRDSSLYTWPPAMVAIRSPHTTFSGCTVSHNYGEGIGINRGSDDSTIEDCIVYNCMMAHIYASRVQRAVIQRNFVWASTTPYFAGGDGPRTGIGLSIDRVGAPYTLGDCTVVNNVVHGFRYPFTFTNGDNPGYGGMKDSLIANNTFVQPFTGLSDRSCIYISSGSADHTGCVFENNICHQTAGTLARGPVDGITFDYNLWRIAAPADFQGANDVTGDPTLASIPAESSTVRLATDYQLLVGSIAIEQGDTIAAVTEDYWGTARPQGANYDIGAHEF